MGDQTKPTLESLQKFLAGEIFQHASDIYQMFFLEEDERVENHVCIKNCIIQEVAVNQWGKTTLTLCYGVNHSGFREGDTVLLNRPGGRGETLITNGFEMDWLEHDPVSRMIRLAQSFNNRGKLPFGRGHAVTIDQSLAGHLQMVSQATAQLAENQADPPFFDAFLQGTLATKGVPVQEELFASFCRTLSLTDSQRESFALATGTFPVVGIQGPPGSGKTFVLAAIAGYYLAKGHNVLVSALSHQAINNALNQAAAVMRTMNIRAWALKVSRNKNDGLHLDEGLPLKIINAIGSWLDSGPNLYGLTSFKAVHDLRGKKIDLLILDEASQLPLPHAFMIMRYARKVILIGDHQQMRPIISYRHHPDPSLYLSIFEYFRALYPDRVRMLTETFRMNDEITAFPSTTFYEGRLKPFGDTGGRLLMIQPAQPGVERKYAEIFDPKKSSVFIEMDHRHATKHCPEEADLVADLIRAAVLDYGISARSIAVLVPFRAQQELIRTRLRQLSQEHHKRLTLVLVDTVERMQGQERDLVIYSLTASDPNRLSAIADFFFDIHRFNVAMTRAKTKRIVIGSRHLLDARPTDPRILLNMNIMCQFFSSQQATIDPGKQQGNK